MSAKNCTNPGLIAKNLLIFLVFLLFLSGCGESSSDSDDSDSILDSVSLKLSSNAKSISFNDSVTLNWSSREVDTCVASGDWSGNKSTSGSEVTTPLTSDSLFILTCSGGSGDISFEVDITVGAPPPLIVSDTNPASYTWSTLTIGARLYVDRSYIYTTVPTAYEGFSLLKTASDDRTSTGDSFISFDTNQATTVYVAHADDGSNLPDWLSLWTLTGEMLSSNDANLFVYKKDFSAGTVVLGGNGNANYMYTAFVASALEASLPPTVSISANPANVVINGTTILNWSSTNASSCTASGDWSGSKSTTGSQTISALTADSNFTLTCSGPGGSANDSASVTVAAPAAPSVNLSASPSNLAYNGSTTLSWTSSNTSSCTASGDWSGSKSTSGSQTFSALTADSNFILTCSGTGGSANDSASVTVAAPLPTLSFSANPTSVAQNDSTTLTWSTTNATSCTASGDWSGSKGTAGSETTSSLTINSQFTLTCSGSGSTVNDTVNVTVVLNQNGTALLSWTPPTLNTDDSPLADLAGYKIRYGTSSGSYSETIIINNPGLTSFLVENLASSTWYFAMTSFNSSGIESSNSIEVNKTIN